MALEHRPYLVRTEVNKGRATCRAWCGQPKCWPQEGQSWSSSYVADRHQGQGRSGLIGSCSRTSLDGSRLAAVPSSSAVKIANTSRLLSGPETTVEPDEARGKDFGGSRPGVGSGWADPSLIVSSARRRRFPFQTRSRLGLLTRLPVFLWLRRRVFRFPSRLDFIGYRVSGVLGKREAGNEERETDNYSPAPYVDHCLPPRRNSARTR